MYIASRPKNSGMPDCIDCSRHGANVGRPATHRGLDLDETSAVGRVALERTLDGGGGRHRCEGRRQADDSLSVVCGRSTLRHWRNAGRPSAPVCSASIASCFEQQLERVVRHGPHARYSGTCMHGLAEHGGRGLALRQAVGRNRGVRAPRAGLVPGVASSPREQLARMRSSNGRCRWQCRSALLRRARPRQRADQVAAHEVVHHSSRSCRTRRRADHQRRWPRRAPRASMWCERSGAGRFPRWASIRMTQRACGTPCSTQGTDGR